MKAGAVRDVHAKPSMVTPIASNIAEALLPIMQYVGIQKLEVKICEASNMKKVSGKISYFNGTPLEMQEFANVIKDSLAEIVSAAGLTYVEINAEQEEIVQLMESYDQLRAMYAAAKISSEDSVQPAIPYVATKNDNGKKVVNKSKKTKMCDVKSRKSVCKNSKCKVN